MSFKELNGNPDFQIKRKEGYKNMSPEAYKKMCEVRRQNGLKNKGRVHSKEHNEKVRDTLRLIRPPKEIKRSNSYGKEWASKIIERDCFCQICGENNQELLEAHHLLCWEHNPSKRLDLDNGIALCKKCHRIFYDLLTLSWINNGKPNLKEYYKLNYSKQVEIL